MTFGLRGCREDRDVNESEYLCDVMKSDSVQCLQNPEAKIKSDYPSATECKNLFSVFHNCKSKGPVVLSLVA